MSKVTANETILGGKRVLDLTDEKGLICGKQLGDMGADVIKIERPGGDPARNIGPFYKDDIHPEKSLFWFAFNLNKRGITLDIETDDGKEIFKEMVREADFVVESFPPGYMDQQGLGYENLEKINPRIVMVSISPFGQTGPYANYKASDIVLMAMAGMVNLCGDPDRAPLRVSVSQSYLFGGALCGTMGAHYVREITGKGQWVDVSLQQGLIYLTINVPVMWDMSKINPSRTGGIHVLVNNNSDGSAKTKKMKTGYRTKDGYVEISLSGGPIFGSSSRAFVEMMGEEGMASDELLNKEWETIVFAELEQEELDSISAEVKKYCLTQTTMALYDKAIERRIMLAPLSTTKQLLENPQLKERDAWVDVEHPELGTTITYPGPWSKFTKTPLVTNRRAPLIGEHNAEIYEGELGMSKKQIEVLRGSCVI